MNTTINPYYLFLAQILKDYRLTIGTFAKQFGFPSFGPIMFSLKADPLRKVHPSTIRKVEQALQIRIDDNDPANLRYERISNEADIDTIFLPTKVETWSVFDVHSKVSKEFPDSGPDSEIIGTEIFDYDKRPGVAALRVPDNSMHPLISQADIILIDQNEPLSNGCIVLAVKPNLDFAVRRYRHVMDDVIQLSTENNAVEPMLYKTSAFKKLYRVVMQARRFPAASANGPTIIPDF